MTKLLISDTADVYLKRKSDGHVFITAESQLASIAQTLGINEKIFGGIGNKPLAVMKGQKEVTTSIRNAFYDQEFLSMTQGVAIESNNVTVQAREDALKVTGEIGSFEVTITGTPIGTDVYIRNSSGTTVKTTVATKKVAVPDEFAKAGELISVTYSKDVTGEIVQLDADKFAEAYFAEYHTIGYDPATNKVVKDIYIQLDHVVPSGEFDLSFENGSAMAPEINFDALAAPNTTSIGRIVEVDRTKP